MLSKNKIKLIHSLEKKKYRNEHGLFVAEGPKLLSDLLAIYRPTYLAATKTWLEANHTLVTQMDGTEVDEVTEQELEKSSLLKNPQQVLAIFHLPQDDTPIGEVATKELCLALDGVQDPGNLGTIVRLADWFGIKHIYCSPTTADIYAPKAIQATMGAISRVHVHYINLSEELAALQAPIYGTHLDGENMYEKELTNKGVIVMGNEGNGISPEVSSLVSEKLYIPPYPAHSTQVESLNVAIATAIVCAEFRRRG